MDGKKGLSEAEAVEKAVEQTGVPPNTLGRQFKPKLHRPNVDWLMIVLLVTTMGLGFLPLMNLDEMYGNLSCNKDGPSFLAILAIVLNVVDYRKFKIMAGYLLHWDSSSIRFSYIAFGDCSMDQWYTLCLNLGSIY